MAKRSRKPVVTSITSETFLPWPVATATYGETVDAWVPKLCARLKAAGVNVLTLLASPSLKTWADIARTQGMKVGMMASVHGGGNGQPLPEPACFHTNASGTVANWERCPGYREGPYGANLANLSAAVDALAPSYVLIDCELWYPCTSLSAYIDVAGCARCGSVSGYDYHHTAIGRDIVAAALRGAVKEILFYSTGWWWPPEVGTRSGPSCYNFGQRVEASDADNLSAFNAMVARGCEWTLTLVPDWWQASPRWGVKGGYLWLMPYFSGTAEATWCAEPWVKNVISLAQEDEIAAATGKRILHTPAFFRQMCLSAKAAGAVGFVLYPGPGSITIGWSTPSSWFGNYTPYWEQRIFDLAKAGIEAFRA